MMIQINNEEGMLALGQAIAVQLKPGQVMFLHGNLGAGKTTLVRGILRGFGYQGKVKSPTFTVVEPYDFNEMTIYHFDLYRLHDPEELDFLGMRDYCHDQSICLIEWPENAEGHLPAPTITCTIEITQQGRCVKIQGL